MANPHGLDSSRHQDEARRKTARPARATTTWPSSSGWRRTSRTCLVNSSISSRNSTPRCAGSPARARLCASADERDIGNRVMRRERPVNQQPCPSRKARPPSAPPSLRATRRRSGAAECLAAAAIIVFPAPGGADEQRLAPAEAISSARLASSWPRTSARSVTGGAPDRRGRQLMTGRASIVQREDRVAAKRPWIVSRYDRRPPAFGVGRIQPALRAWRPRRSATRREPDGSSHRRQLPG